METFSWSRINTFSQCPRKYELQYQTGIELKPSADNSGRMFGTAIHAGLQTMLIELFRGSNPEYAINKSVDAARTNIEVSTVQNKMKYNWTKGADEVDLDYYLMIEELINSVPKFLRYYLPRMELGTRYTPLSISQVLPDMQLNHVPAVEWEFTLPLDDETSITGRIDAVLWDNVEQEAILFDWKSRKAFPRDDMALIDGQLHLYAAVLNTQGANVRSVCMAQMLTGLPKPAELSKKDNLPLTGRESYATTWDFWVSSLPVAVDAEYYRDIMFPKMKQHLGDFYRPVFGYVTETSSALTMDNTKMQIENIKMVLDNGSMSGVYSYQACQFCQFQRLCANGFRYGGNVTEIIEHDYQKRHNVDLVMEDTPE